LRLPKTPVARSGRLEYDGLHPRPVARIRQIPQSPRGVTRSEPRDCASRRFVDARVCLGKSAFPRPDGCGCTGDWAVWRAAEKARRRATAATPLFFATKFVATLTGLALAPTFLCRVSGRAEGPPFFGSASNRSINGSQLTAQGTAGLSGRNGRTGCGRAVVALEGQWNPGLGAGLGSSCRGFFDG
jgi:hypothetical protein